MNKIFTFIQKKRSLYCCFGAVKKRHKQSGSARTEAKNSSKNCPHKSGQTSNSARWKLAYVNHLIQFLFFSFKLCAFFMVCKIGNSLAILAAWVRWRLLPSHNLKGKMMTKTCMTRRQIRTAISKMPPTQAMWRETLKLVAQLKAEIVVLKKSNSWVWPAVLFGTPLKYC